MSALTDLYRAIRRQDLPTAHEHFLAVMREKMQRVIHRETQEVARDYGQQLSQK